jgi:predicted RNA-binding protein YlqC (UPF0109 family)
MSETTPQEQQFLEFILSWILAEPEKAVIERTVDEKGILLTVQVPEEEMGKLIGKGGKTVQSIRTLLSAMGAKQSEHIYLKILEPENK